MMCFFLIYRATKWICLIPFITLVFSTSNGDFASALFVVTVRYMILTLQQFVIKFFIICNESLFIQK